MIHWLKGRGEAETLCGLFAKVGANDEVVTFIVDGKQPDIEPECQKCRSLRDAADRRVVRYDVFTLRDKNTPSARYLTVGNAWRNRDGTVTVFLDSLPTDGQLLLREAVGPKPSGPKR
jgi:hypothetical protein